MLERRGGGAFEYDLHGGGAELTTIQWYFHERSRLPVAVQMWELPPGGAEGMHAHGVGPTGSSGVGEGSHRGATGGERAAELDEEPLEELYLVVEGGGSMRVDGEEHQLGPGDAVLAPAGSEHDLHNTGEGTLRVVVVWGRPAAPVDWSAFGTARAARRQREQRTKSTGSTGSASSTGSTAGTGSTDGAGRPARW